MKNLLSRLFTSTCPITLLSILFALVAEPSHAEEHGWKTCLSKGHLLNASYETKPGVGGRHYERDRRIDVKHLKLDLVPDFEKQAMSGVATMTFSPIAKPVDQLHLDAIKLSIQKVESSAPLEDWENNDKQVILTFKNDLPVDQDAWVKITFSVEKPERGLYFRTEAMGYPKGDDQLWTQGEPERHRYWFPGYDYPNERFTSEVICKVPKGMTVLSNGKLLSEKTTDNFTTFHWSQEKPHVNYLISVVAGYFKKLEDKHEDTPLAFYTPPSEFEVAANSFRDTSQIMAFFEKEIGVSYPWNKYFSVCVHDFIAGGMENTSLTTLTTNTLFSDSSENIRTSRHLDAHEMAHQWFGDLLTCKDWSQLWLNEGFATYYTHLYELSKNGKEAMHYGQYSDAKRVLGTKDDKPITWRGYEVPFEQFDYRAYPKGGWVLHMLRSQLGPELYQKCIQTYVERNRGKAVETADLRKVIEELSGRSWDRFFDQWVHHGGTPKIKIAYNWDEKRKQAKLSISQTQKVSAKVMLFVLPLPVQMIVDGKAYDFTLNITEASEDFYFDLPKKPSIVRIDPDYTVLASIDFQPPADLLAAQLKNKDDMMGRLLAAQQLGGKKDSKSINQLKQTLNNDPFFGVRIEASKALAKTHTPEALEALNQSLAQKDARVRQEVVRSLTKFYDDKSLASLKKIVAQEKNPLIASAAIDGMGKFPSDQVEAILSTALNRSSFRNSLSSAAIRAIRNQGKASGAEKVLKTLQNNKPLFTSRDFGNSLNSLAALVKDEKPGNGIHEKVRIFITQHLSDPKRTLRTAAMRALATLNDPRSLPALQTFIDSGNEKSDEYKTAQSAIKKLNSEKKQSDEVTDLRKEVLSIQKSLQEIQKKLETSKKQNQAKTQDAAKGK